MRAVESEGTRISMSSERNCAAAAPPSRPLRSTRRSSFSWADRMASSTLADFPLVEIANSPDEMDTMELARLRTRVRRQGILMKIEIIGNDAKQREKSAAGDRLRL